MSEHIDIKLSLLYLLRKVEYFIFLFVGYELVKNENNIKIVGSILDISIIIHFIIAIFQKNGILGGFVNGIYTSTRTVRVISTFNGPYEFATFLTLLLPIYIVKLMVSNKNINVIIKNITLIVMIFISIFLTESRTSLIISIILLIIIPLIKKKKEIINYIKKKKILACIIAIISLLIVLITGTLLSKTGRFKTLNLSSIINTIKISWSEKNFERYQDEGFYIVGEENTDLSFKIRINKWMALIDGTMKSPILGLGASITREACDGNYIRILAESGILGLFAWILLCIVIIKSTKNNIDNMNILAFYGMLVLFLTAIFIDVFEASKIMMFYWFIVGAAYSYSNINYKTTPKDNSVSDNNKRCSIVMATYNGEKYIKEQIDSILKNMNDEDELIISDDGSKDNTIKMINEYDDKRIILIDGPRKGVKQNFANAIAFAKGKYIFLSDQDDIWNNDKIELILQEFEKSKASVVIHDAEVINENMEITIPSFFEYRNSGNGIWKNIYKNTYIGCCMAFKSNIKKDILPIPNNIEMHDQWIGILGESKGNGSIFLKEKLIQYRRHSNNVSQMNHYGIFKMIKNRIIFMMQYLRRYFKEDFL